MNTTRGSLFLGDLEGRVLQANYANELCFKNFSL